MAGVSDPKRVRPAPHQIWRGVRESAKSDAFGGLLLVGAAVVSLVVANTPLSGLYTSVRDTELAIPALHLHLTVGQWASDGLLAIFFFVVGLELKEEFVAGKLRNPKKAAVPIAAAFGGVAVPAVIFTLIVTLSGQSEALRGWAIPTATDIAFAVAVLAIVGRGLPPALRIFLLTLAIVDDLIAITIIAVFYTEHLQLVYLLLAIVPLALFALLTRRGITSWWLLLPLAMVTWWLVHAAGIHATIAGVLLGFMPPVVATASAHVRVLLDDGEPAYEGIVAHLADQWGIFSTLVAVPVFAFFSAGVTVGGLEGLGKALTDPITLGIIAGLVVGKPLGIVGTAFLLDRLPAFQLDETLGWGDMLGVGFVAGVGFTVSLLVGELAFGPESVADEHVKIGVLLGSFVAAIIGGFVCSWRAKARQAESATTA